MKADIHGIMQREFAKKFGMENYKSDYPLYMTFHLKILSKMANAFKKISLKKKKVYWEEHSVFKIRHVGNICQKLDFKTMGSVMMA